MSHLKALPKVIPIRNREMTRERLISAVGKVVAEVGFKQLGVNMVAREAGVDKKLIYRYFGGLNGLEDAYGRTVEFWPNAEELLGDDRDRIRGMAPSELMSVFFKRYLRAILQRPQTLEILAWEGLERNRLTQGLEGCYGAGPARGVGSYRPGAAPGRGCEFSCGTFQGPFQPGWCGPAVRGRVGAHRAMH